MPIVVLAPESAAGYLADTADEYGVWFPTSVLTTRFHAPFEFSSAHLPFIPPIRITPLIFKRREYCLGFEFGNSIL